MTDHRNVSEESFDIEAVLENVPIQDSSELRFLADDDEEAETEGDTSRGSSSYLKLTPSDEVEIIDAVIAEHVWDLKYIDKTEKEIAAQYNNELQLVLNALKTRFKNKLNMKRLKKLIKLYLQKGEETEKELAFSRRSQTGSNLTDENKTRDRGYDLFMERELSVHYLQHKNRLIALAKHGWQKEYLQARRTEYIKKFIIAEDLPHHFNNDNLHKRNFLLRQLLTNRELVDYDPTIEEYVRQLDEHQREKVVRPRIETIQTSVGKLNELRMNHARSSKLIRKKTTTSLGKLLKMQKVATKHQERITELLAELTNFEEVDDTIGDKTAETEKDPMGLLELSGQMEANEKELQESTIHYDDESEMSDYTDEPTASNRVSNQSEAHDDILAIDAENPNIGSSDVDEDFQYDDD